MILQRQKVISILTPELTRQVLDHLNVSPAAPDLALLDRLVAAYIRTVPWESAFRIAKRARTLNTEDCPRWPEEFWDDAMECGGGGTCFESNYAFFGLLRSLGYEGYLTINDVGDHPACHTAIVVPLDGEKWLVDVGWPVHSPLLIGKGQTQRDSLFHTYTLQTDDGLHYTLTRSNHPSPYCFSFIDTPVDDTQYRAATTGDYSEAGLFLDRVIMNKVMDEQLWRFTSGEAPFVLQRFEGAERFDTPIEGDAAAVTGRHFGMDEATVRAAFAALGLN